MRSAWFWGTAQWDKYQTFYYSDRPYVAEYKSSPLADDHDFMSKSGCQFDLTHHQTQVLDLTLSQQDLWHGIRKSYRPLINKAVRDYDFLSGTLDEYHHLHAMASGRETRCRETWDCMLAWLRSGLGGLVMARNRDVVVSGAYFIIYRGASYYASGASLMDNVQHAVIWVAIQRLKAMGVRLLDLGQTDGETEKEKGIGHFKAGFGGKSMPFTIAKRRV